MNKYNVRDIEPWNNSIIIDFHIACFERDMTIVFRDFEDFSKLDAITYLTGLYQDWCEDDKGWCCEEYMLEHLPENYKNHIICVIYGEENRED